MIPYRTIVRGCMVTITSSFLKISICRNLTKQDWEENICSQNSSFTDTYVSDEPFRGKYRVYYQRSIPWSRVSNIDDEVDKCLTDLYINIMGRERSQPRCIGQRYDYQKGKWVRVYDDEDSLGAWESVGLL